jgi:hypothetical protein
MQRGAPTNIGEPATEPAANGAAVVAPPEVIALSQALPPRCHRRAAALPLVALLAALAALLPAPASAQFVLDDHEELDFDRPEAWAMAWFATVSFPSPLGTEPLPPGAVELSLEGGWVPTLSEEQRTVGFTGNKPEDLNRTSAFGRPRVAVGLPGRLTATLSWTPPVEIGGIEPNVLSLAIARPLWASDRSHLSARLLGQQGKLDGDLSCPADIVGISDPLRNPSGCERTSRDEMSSRLVGLELQAGTKLQRWPRLSPYAAVAWSRLHAEYQVDAFRRGFHDRTLLETDGEIWSGALGLSLEAGRRARLAGELFYTPLDVVGRAGKGHETDGLLNLRVLLGWRAR